MTMPEDTPFSMRMPAMGIMVSTRMYMGMPTTAASGMAHRLSAPAKFSSKLGGHEAVDERADPRASEAAIR